MLRINTTNMTEAERNYVLSVKELDIEYLKHNKITQALLLLQTEQSVIDNIVVECEEVQKERDDIKQGG